MTEHSWSKQAEIWKICIASAYCDHFHFVSLLNQWKQCCGEYLQPKQLHSCYQRRARFAVDLPLSLSARLYLNDEYFMITAHALANI